MSSSVQKDEWPFPSLTDLPLSLSLSHSLETNQDLYEFYLTQEVSCQIGSI